MRRVEKERKTERKRDKEVGGGETETETGTQRENYQGSQCRVKREIISFKLCYNFLLF